MKTDWLQLISPCVRPLLRSGIYKSYTSHGLHTRTWTEPLRVIYDHELVLFSQGCCRVEIEGREYVCPTDSFIIIPPGRWHVTWNTGRGSGHRHWSHFDWVYSGPYGETPILTYHPAKPIPRLYRLAPPFVPKTILHGAIPSPPRAYDLMERLCQIQMVGGKHEKLASRALLLDLLLQLLDAPDEPLRSKRRPSWLAHLVRERLEDMVEKGGDIPPIRTMLEEFRYSYAHLCRLFRAEYGIAPLKYVHALRVSRAKLLMRDTQLNISEIAFKVGFHDLAYFCQLFRKMTGQTPTTYRARLKGG
jgi:AraC-like DNA-binding protein